MENSGEPGRPLFQVETVPGPPDRGGKAQFFDTLMINRRASSVAYKVLLLPIHSGQPLPLVKYDAKANVATVRWANQSDTLRFNVGDDSRTRLSATRGDTQLFTQP
jgi:hypothetical protein